MNRMHTLCAHTLVQAVGERQGAHSGSRQRHGFEGPISLPALASSHQVAMRHRLLTGHADASALARVEEVEIPLRVDRMTESGHSERVELRTKKRHSCCVTNSGGKPTRRPTSQSSLMARDYAAYNAEAGRGSCAGLRRSASVEPIRSKDVAAKGVGGMGSKNLGLTRLPSDLDSPVAQALVASREGGGMGERKREREGERIVS